MEKPAKWSSQFKSLDLEGSQEILSSLSTDLKEKQIQKER
jgi:hypothetical protein